MGPEAPDHLQTWVSFAPTPILKDQSNCTLLCRYIKGLAVVHGTGYFNKHLSRIGCLLEVGHGAIWYD